MTPGLKTRKKTLREGNRTVCKKGLNPFTGFRPPFLLPDYSLHLEATCLMQIRQL